MSSAAETARQPRASERANYPRLAEPPSERGSARRDLRCSVADASFYSVMVGMGEANVQVFGLALGLGQVVVGMMLTVPVLIGAVLQLAAPWAVRWVGSHRRWVVCCAACQATCMLALPLAALLTPAAAFWMVYSAMSLYWASSLATGPAWSTWIESLVPRRLRARFFGQRARIGHACVLLGFVVGGLLLEMGKMHHAVLATFTVLFCVAALFRFASAICLACKSEPHAGHLSDRRVGWGEMFSRVRGAESGRLLMFLLAMQVAVYVSAPYFVPYMRGVLKIGYLEYTILVGLTYIGKFALLPLFYRLAEVIGPRRLLTVCTLLVVPLSALWIVSQSLVYIGVLQFVAGGMWGGFEYAMLLMFFEAIPKAERTSLLTVYNLGNAGAMALGSIIGGFVLTLTGASMLGYVAIFAISSSSRLISVGLLRRVPVMTGAALPVANLVTTTRTVALRADRGSLEMPIVPLLGGNSAVVGGCMSQVEAAK